MNLRFISLTQQIYHSILTVVGTLINLFVVFVIYYSRQLHYPRHLFWAAISLINEFSIIQTLLEIVAILHGNRVACQIFVFNAGVSYTISLTFLALAALDRYLAIGRYEWYKNKVTNRGAVYLLSFGFIVTYATITSPFWTGFKDFRNCTINLTHMHCVMIYDLLLGFLCVILHIMIFLRSRKAARQHQNYLETSIAMRFTPTPSINLRVPNGKLLKFFQFSFWLFIFINYIFLNFLADQRVEIPLREREPSHIDATGISLPRQLDDIAESGDHNGLGDTLCLPWFFNRPKLNRLEIIAALNMSINILPVWLCTFPVTLNAIMIYWCIRLEMNCPVIYRINPYIRDMFLFHNVYTPLMYMLTSSEFKRALIHCKRKFKRNYSVRT
jgi:hypothetical protein